MTWTREKPTTPGWYWWRDINLNAQILRVQFPTGWLAAEILVAYTTHLQWIGGACLGRIDEFDGEWSDFPIDLPKERT